MDERLSLFRRVVMLKRLLGNSLTLLGTDTEPYLYRRSPSLGDYKTERDEIVGVSVGWNQLISGMTNSGTSQGVDYSWSNGKCSLSGTSSANGSVAVASTYPQYVVGHKYFICGCPKNGANNKYSLRYNANGHGENGNGAILTGATTRQNNEIQVGSNYPLIAFASGVDCTGLVFEPMVTDLTLDLGSTIADYVYSLEQSTSGSGVAWLKEHFPKMFGQYNPFDSGSIRSVEGLVSHDMVGFNAFDEEWENGYYDIADGSAVASNTWQRNKNAVPCLPSTSYCLKQVGVGGSFGYILYYDAGDNYLSSAQILSSATSDGFIFTTPNNAHRIKLYRQVASRGLSLCINISDAELNGQYKAYEKHSYPLDSTVTLRGLLKLEDGKLKADGDIYKASGEIVRNWGERAYQEGDVSDFTTMITDGTTTVYKLTTPTTETAQPFAKNQKVSPSGTEEYVTTSVVPVGHNTEYYG